MFPQKQACHGCVLNTEASPTTLYHNMFNPKGSPAVLKTKNFFVISTSRIINTYLASAGPPSMNAGWGINDKHRFTLYLVNLRPTLTSSAGVSAHVQSPPPLNSHYKEDFMSNPAWWKAWKNIFKND